MFSYESVSITGHDGKSIPNTFFRQNRKSDHLAIIFPGRGYTCAMPLLYYMTNVLLDLGADVLQVDYKYEPFFWDLSPGDRDSKFAFDVGASTEAVVAHGRYSRLTLVGKSLGTRALGYFASKPGVLPPVEVIRSVWLTPLTGDDQLYSQMMCWEHPSLYVIGTADTHCYRLDRQRVLETEKGWRSVIVEGADHSLDIDQDVPRSLTEMKRVMVSFQEFLK